MQRGLTAWCLIILLAASLFACQVKPAATAPVTAPTADAVDVVVLIDSSGSMRTSDPGQLSLTASRMLIDLLATGDRAALLDFDSKARVVAPLTVIDDSADRAALQAKLATVRADGYTDYATALAAAYEQLAGAKDDVRHRCVIFLTDGRPDPNGRTADQAFMKNYLAGLQATVDQFAARGWPIHTIGLGSQPDPALLRDIALATGGSYQRVSNAADLTGVFAGILTEAKGLYLGGNYARALTSGPTSDAVVVDEFTRSMTVVAVGRQGQAVELTLSRDGQAVAPGSGGVERRSGAGYDALFVSQPAAGVWQVGIAGDGEATLLLLFDKTVRLDLVAPATNARLPVGRPLTLVARLTRGERAFNGRIVAHILRPGTTVAEDVTLLDDGAHGDGAANDGVFGNTWSGVQSEGDYRVLIEAMQGGRPIVSRSLQIYGETLPLITVDAPSVGTHYRGERMTLAVHFALAGLPLSPAETANVNVKAEIAPPGGQPTVLTLTDQGSAASGDLAAGDGVFSAVYVPSSEGEHLVRFVADGTLRGRAYHDEIALPAMPVERPVFVKVERIGRLPRIAPGGTSKLSLELASESEQEETVEVSLLPGGGLTGAPATVTLSPHGRARATLTVEAAPTATLGQQEVLVVCKGRNGVAFDPATLPVHVLIGRNSILAMVLRAIAAVALVLVLTALVYRGGGRALYRAARRRARVGGRLSWSGPSSGACELERFGKTEVTVGGPGTDVVLDGCSVPVLFRIRTRALTVGSPTVLGWASLRGKLSFGCEIVAEGDQRVSFRDFPKGLERLFHGDEFRCGEFAFKYENSKLPPRPRRGA